MPPKTMKIDLLTLRNIRESLGEKVVPLKELLTQLRDQISVEFNRMKQIACQFSESGMLPKDVFVRTKELTKLQPVLEAIQAAQYPAQDLLDRLNNPINGPFQTIEGLHAEAKNLFTSFETEIGDDEIFYQIHLSVADRERHVRSVLSESSLLYNSIDIMYRQARKYIEYFTGIVEAFNRMDSQIRLKQKIRDQEAWMDKFGSNLNDFTL